MKTIWFNHWFSTAYNIIQMLRQENPDFRIIGSNRKSASPIAAVCDEWYQEPSDLKDDAYVDFCLDFCKTHHVDVFLPRSGMLAISRRRDEFEALGIRVMVDDFAIVNILNHKDIAYQELAARGVTTIPEYEIVTSAGDFAAAYERLSAKYKAVCFKFVHDEGGKSYRLIDNTRRGYEALFKKQTTRITFEDAFAALSEREVLPPVMVMPYLSGVELSVDCLQTEDGLIMLPRIKDASRIERMSFSEETLRITQEVYDAVQLQCPCNIQFKLLDGVPYFLEVNTRMSGGVQMACAATSVNIPDIAVNKLLGIRKPWQINKEERCVTHVETPIVL